MLIKQYKDTLMKRIIIILLLSVLALDVSAHPGRTDANGGHHDRTSGGYHYHHGYPAHQHTDGSCPYSFDDATEDSSPYSGTSSNTQSKHDENMDRLKIEKDEKDEDRKEQQDEGNTKSRIDNILVIILVVVVIFIISGIIPLLKSERIRREQQRKWQEERNEYYKLYAFKDPITCVDVPDNVYLRGEIPVTDDAGEYGAYTVYITQKGKCFHQKQNCVPNTESKHIFQVYKTHTACKRCVKKAFPQYKWYVKYRKIVDIKKKYDIP